MEKQLKFFNGGIHPPHQKNTSNMATEKINLPIKVYIPMLQHIGAPSIPLVQKGDKILVGQKIGDSQSFVGSPVHSSVSGIVKDISPMLHPNGSEILTIEIESDGLQDVYPSIKPPENLNKESFIKLIRESGLVGLGGAGFPTAIKLSPPPDKLIDILVVNGSECEPYITSDYREMLENTKNILDGIKIVMDINQIKHGYIGIESNKPEAIKQISKISKEYPNIKVISLKTRYPQGGEKQLIYSITGRKVPSGKLPSDVGVLVQNINTLSFICEFLKTGMPLIKKKVTVDGSAVLHPKNVEVLIGTPLKDIFEYCGGFCETPVKIIMGGPMMGVAQYSLQNPVIKQTNALLALGKNEAMQDNESVCLRCGKCVSVCPMKLLPLFLNLNVVSQKFEENIKYNINDCIECGCCSYICPASRHLVQSIRSGKAQLRKISQK